MAEHALADHRRRLHVEGHERRRGAMELVMVGHGGTPATRHRQARLRAVERLHLALLFGRKDQWVLGRIDVEPDDVEGLLDELQVFKELEGLDPLRLQSVPAPPAVRSTIHTRQTWWELLRSKTTRSSRSRSPAEAGPECLTSPALLRSYGRSGN